MKITRIEFENYKAFYGKGIGNTINIPFGKNLFIYGENGSGKSSIYEGVKQFFNSSQTNEVPYRNINAPEKIFSEDDNKDIPNETSVQITFAKNKKKGTEKTLKFGTNGDDLNNIEFVKKANSLNSFLSYKEILKTYLFDTKNVDFGKEFANLLLNDILVNRKNLETNNTYRKDWEKLFTPRRKYNTKIDLFEPLIYGLKKDLTEINFYLKSIIKFFDKDIEVQIEIDDYYIDYFHAKETDRDGLHPVLDVGLTITNNGVKIDDSTQNHLLVLNEARLSFISISFYLSVLVFFAKSNSDYRILFLDDIFIGLDMSNRLPLLNILQNYVEPNSTNKEPFFNSFQIFMTTYDKVLFELARNFLGEDNWKYVEMYSEKIKNGNFNIPVIIDNDGYLKKAEFYLSKHDYKASAVYIRTEFERVVKRICEKYRLKVLYKKNTKEVKSDDFWQSIKSNLKLDETVIKDIETYRSSVMNPFSHYDLEKPEFKIELEKTIEAIKQLSNLKDVEKVDLKKEVRTLKEEIKRKDKLIENLKKKK